jgi:mycofactocin precursor
MPSHTNVNRPVRTSTATLPRDVVDVDLDDLVDEETLVEEVSIDGMCGVY